MQADRLLLRWRAILGYAAGAFAICLLTVLYAAGDGELVRIAKASFEKPACCIDRAKDPIAK